MLTRNAATLAAAIALFGATAVAQAPPPRPAEAAARAYLTAVSAFNSGRAGAEAFFGSFTADYCHFAKRLDDAALRRLYAKQFAGKPTRIDARVEPLRTSPDQVLFLQSELLGATLGTQRRYFKFVLMRRTAAGWRLAATGTRKKHGCAPKLLEGVEVARVDALKARIMRDDVAAFVPRGCRLGGAWDGKDETSIDCKRVSLPLQLRAWKATGTDDDGSSAGSIVISHHFRHAGWLLTIALQCSTAGCDEDEEAEEAEEPCSCEVSRAELRPPK